MKKFVVLFFGVTWLFVIAGAATPFGAIKDVYYNEHTKYCTYKTKHPYVIATIIADFINDTLILLAIMYKLSMADIRRSPTSLISTAWKPMDHFQSFTKVFLQDSQIYYA